MPPDTSAIPCRRCGARTCEHHELLARAFGLKGAGLCFPCLAAALELPAPGIAESVFGYVHQKDCYREEWREISRCSLGGEGRSPVCLPWSIPEAYAALTRPPGDKAPASPDAAPAARAEDRPGWRHDSEFDGGDTGCGDLLFDLRLAIRPLESGARILVTARDPGARIDLPAWSRVTGHGLIEAEHPYYLFERKRED